MLDPQFRQLACQAIFIGLAGGGNGINGVDDLPLGRCLTGALSPEYGA
jgi:hypothetical protein